MATEIIMPKVDMVMETGTFVEWLREEGAAVQKGEPLFVVLTDKANIEIEAPASGILAGVKARPNDVIPVTQTIGYVLAPGEALPAKMGVRSQEPTQTPAERRSPELARRGERPQQVEDSSLSVNLFSEEAGGGAPGKVRATPAARRLAADMGMDLDTLPGGRGPRGRIHKADILAAAEQRPAAPVAQPAMPTPTAAVMAAPGVRLPETRQKQVIPLTGVRKIIAERMAYSASTAPHIALSLRVDMSEAARLRARVQEHVQQKTGQRLSFTAIIARAVAAVLPHHPYLNASLEGERIILWEDVHLGIATSLEDYLIVPVIRQAQTRNLEQLVAELSDLVERARARRLTPAEMSGSTFTISNLGMFGIESFTAIINPPETAILAVGQIVDTPIGVEQPPCEDRGLPQVILRPMMNLTLSVDHRVVDGTAGARFLADLKKTLENPYLLI